MLYKNTKNGGEIHTWFPKSIYYIKQLENKNLNNFETYIKNFKFSPKRTELLQVDSSHEVINLHDKKLFKKLFKQFLIHSKVFLSEMGYSDIFSSNIKIASSWFNISKRGDYLQKHIHPHSILSGAYYVKSNVSDKIIFHNENDMTVLPSSFTTLSYSEAFYDCVPGSLLLFKSNLPHSTNRQIGDEKIVISFNIVGNS